MGGLCVRAALGSAILISACGTSGVIHPGSNTGGVLCAVCMGSLSAGSGSAGTTAGAGGSSSSSGSLSSSSSSSSSSGGLGASSGAGSTGGGFTPAPHAPFAQIPGNQGQVIAAPQLVTVGFPGDEGYDLNGFGDWIMRSDWLESVGAEYGVGLGGHLQHFVADIALGGGSTIDDVAVRAFLAVSAADGGLSPPTGSTIYLVVFPAGVTVTSGSFGTSCQNFGGYHDRFSQDGRDFIYAVIPTCPAGRFAAIAPPAPVVASHELLEAATDPSPGNGYSLSSGAWAVLGSEVGDLCEGVVFQSDAGYLVQRIWSNRLAAQADGSPCAPRPPGEVYFNVTAIPTAAAGGQFYATVSASAQSQPIDFQLTAWSTAPVGFGLDLAQLGGPQITAVLKTDGGPPVLHNGEVLTLTVTVPGGVGSGQDIGVAIVTSSDGFQTQNLAPLLIQVR